MSLPSKTVTVAEVIDAIEKNGYPQIKGHWVEFKDGIISGCAIGQAALNLGVSYTDLTNKLSKVRQDKRRDYSTMGNLILYLNDRRSKTIPEIVEQLRAKFAGRMEDTLTLAEINYKKKYGVDNDKS